MSERLHQIDAMRGLAAVAVAFVFHQHYLTGQFQTGPLDGLPLFTWLHDNGWVMVDLFFVISGYIFAHVYLATGRIDDGAAPFAKARFARLYPLHFATLLAAAGVFLIGTPSSVTYTQNDIYHFVLNILMLQDSGLQDKKSFNIPSWSISVEVFCYIVFYLLASRIKRGLTALSACIAIGAMILTISDSPTLDHVARGFCGFFAGVVAQRGGGKVVLRFALASLCIALLLNTTGFRVSLGAILGAGLFPFLLLGVQGVAFLAHRAFVWLGDRSYGIYLVHAPIYMGINVVIFGGERIPDAYVWPAILGAWIAILVASDLSLRFLEDPARRWLMKADWSRFARESRQKAA